MHHPSSVASSCPGRAAHLAQRRRDLVAHVVLEAEVGVGLVGHAPVEQEDVVALVEQELDERVARAQVEDVGAVDEGEDEEDRDRVRALGRAVAVERRRAMRPHHVLGRDGDLRVALGQHDVGELERGDRRAGHALERVHRDELRGGAGRADAGFARGRGLGAVVARGVDLLAQALHLLQDLLELVLGAAELLRQARDVAPPGEPQVAPHEIHGVEADPREGDDVLGRHRQHLAERLPGDHALGGLRHARFGLLVEAASLFLRGGTLFGHR